MEVLYVSIAQELEHQMRSGELAVGQKLSERQLAEKYGVSRTVIREALRSLSEKGLVEPVCGRGNFVRKPGEERLVSNISEFMDNSDLPIKDIVQARKMIECTIVPDIIQNASEDVLEQLKEQIAKMQECESDISGFVKLDEEFHLTMISCANNRTILLLTKTLNKVTNRWELFTNGHARTGAIDEHRQMVAAIEQGDEEELRRMISYHIDSLCEYL